MAVFGWRRRAESPTGGPSRSAGDTTKTEDRGNCRPDLTERFVPSPLTPHERRHAYASLMIGAGVNPKTLSTYMGHANISITLDRYGHLFPGAEHEAAAMLDAYLARAVNRGGS